MGIFDISFGAVFSRPKEIVLKKGESIIIACWSWHELGYKRRMVQVNENGDVKVTDL